MYLLHLCNMAVFILYLMKYFHRGLKVRCRYIYYNILLKDIYIFELWNSSSQYFVELSLFKGQKSTCVNTVYINIITIYL